ncbi:hypothetical protein EsH8_II_000891 [Colletotrichum jinshuiense]
MRPLFGHIPRLYAPLRSLARQSFGPSPALTAANATTATLRSNMRMSTSSGSQSTTAGSAAANGAAGAATVAMTATEKPKSEGSHRGHHPTESTSPAPENATSNAPADGTANTSSTSDSSQPHPLALPPLPEASGNSAGGNDGSAPITTLDMGGSRGGSVSTKLDHLGPLVVNQDGTMSRISNWGEMSEIERQNTLRILGRRNQIRLAKLRDGAETDGQGSTGRAGGA